MFFLDTSIRAAKVGGFNSRAFTVLGSFAKLSKV